MKLGSYRFFGCHCQRWKRQAARKSSWLVKKPVTRTNFSSEAMAPTPTRFLIADSLSFYLITINFVLVLWLLKYLVTSVSDMFDNY
jgi:hypothetical protein